MKLKRMAAAFTPVRGRQTLPSRPPSDVRLSVIMPYYKRIHDFTRVFRMNASWLARKDVEVVLALDEPTEETEVLELVKPCGVQVKVVVNDEDHAWRAPPSAINVGIRAARGDLILVISPESAFVGDVPSQFIQATVAQPGAAIVGQLAFATFQETAALQTKFHSRNHDRPVFFGSMCAPKAMLEDVRGYDESFIGWGGDDMDVRARIQMAGYALYSDEDIRVLHLSERPRSMRGTRTPDEQQIQRSRFPKTPFANPGGWGESFSRVAWDWR